MCFPRVLCPFLSMCWLSLSISVLPVLSLGNPPVSWPGLFYPAEQDRRCRQPVGSRICSPFPRRIPRGGVPLALPPEDVLETGGFPAAPATILPWEADRGR